MSRALTSILIATALAATTPALAAGLPGSEPKAEELDTGLPQALDAVRLLEAVDVLTNPEAMRPRARRARATLPEPFDACATAPALNEFRYLEEAEGGAVYVVELRGCPIGPHEVVSGQLLYQPPFLSGLRPESSYDERRMALEEAREWMHNSAEMWFHLDVRTGRDSRIAADGDRWGQPWDYETSVDLMAHRRIGVPVQAYFEGSRRTAYTRDISVTEGVLRPHADEGEPLELVAEDLVRREGEDLASGGLLSYAGDDGEVEIRFPRDPSPDMAVFVVAPEGGVASYELPRF